MFPMIGVQRNMFLGIKIRGVITIEALPDGVYEQVTRQLDTHASEISINRHTWVANTNKNMHGAVVLGLHFRNGGVPQGVMTNNNNGQINTSDIKFTQPGRLIRMINKHNMLVLSAPNRECSERTKNEWIRHHSLGIKYRVHNNISSKVSSTPPGTSATVSDMCFDSDYQGFQSVPPFSGTQCSGKRKEMRYRQQVGRLHIIPGQNRSA